MFKKVIFSEVCMYILSEISWGAWTVIIAVALIVIFIAAGAIKRIMYPEKKSKPWKTK